MAYPATADPRRPGRAAVVKLVLAGLAVVAFYASVRAASPAPWSYDEYYHLGVARELGAHFPLRAFPWTPFSLLSERFADGTPLFHLLLRPWSGLPIEEAGLAGVIVCQLFLVASFAWALWRLRVPNAYAFLLGLATLGSMFAMRVDMCRPHLLLIGFSVLLVGMLLSERRPLALFVVSALFGLAHAGGWIGIAYAAAWALAGVLATGAPEERRLLWRPMAWIAAGWAAGQLIHPNFPQNLRLLALVNFVIPFQASPAGNLALRSQIGEELTAPGLGIVAEQWPLFLAPLLVVWLLLREPRLRTRATLTSAFLAAGFLLLGSLMLRRFLELGAPLGLLALGVVVAERRRQGGAGLLGSWGPWIAPMALFVGALWTSATVRSYGFGRVSAPQEMARWLGEHGQRGERVFTAQWADAAPLFYYAPQLQSLVALDPTLFFIRDPALFQQYVDVVQGRSASPAAAIRGQFGARYVTLWRVPVYSRLAAELLGTAGVKTVFSDPHYLVLDLAPR